MKEKRWNCYTYGDTAPDLTNVKLRYIRLERGDEIIGFIFCDQPEEGKHNCWATKICEAMNAIDKKGND